jgi:hypothetical protein
LEVNYSLTFFQLQAQNIQQLRNHMEVQRSQMDRQREMIEEQNLIMQRQAKQFETFQKGMEASFAQHLQATKETYTRDKETTLRHAQQQREEEELRRTQEFEKFKASHKKLQSVVIQTRYISVAKGR